MRAWLSSSRTQLPPSVANSIKLASEQQRQNNLTGAIATLSTALKECPGNIALSNKVAQLELTQLKLQGQIPGVPASPAPSKATNVESICECFWELEQKHSLLTWQVNGVFPWRLVRMRLYYNITQLTGIFTPPHPAQKNQLSHVGKRELKAVKAYWDDQERGPNEQASSKRYAILMATRRADGSEPYSKALREEIGGEALLLDRPHIGDASTGAINFPALAHLFHTRYQTEEDNLFSLPDLILCEQISAGFKQCLGVAPENLASMCQRMIAQFLPLERGFKRFFEINPVEKLFLTDGYGPRNQAVVSAARASGVHTVELQHGFISRFHLGYSWPGQPDVPYSADELWTFGDFWAQSTPLPVKMKPRAIGAPYVRQLAGANPGPRDERLVVFTSQGVVGHQLFKIALATAQRRPDRRVVFRLHPSESLEMYDEASAETPFPENFEVSHRTPNIFTLLAQTAIQVGAFSTTLFEGMALGTRTIVVNLPGAEYMRPVIERGDAIYVQSIAELIEKLDQAPLAADPEFYYAKAADKLVLDR